mmetsp:Transcript_24984/g.65047  ORF Transcript_24984/g.65047 Transcript_24984/m.65047 type:complete len:399 (-) Transcript_24984:152-1348(-)
MAIAAARPIRIGTDCSGMEAPVMAIRNLKVAHKHVFSCDIDKNSKKTIEANYDHDIFYDDLCKRDNKAAPQVDLYVAGFPCQPFSMAGLRQGFRDKKGRGKIFFKVLEYIDEQRPKTFVLENVRGLKTMWGGRVLKKINKELDDLGDYNIYFQVLDTRDHGVPHHRCRCYWVGILKSCDDGSFKFPEAIPCPRMEDFLDTRPKASVRRAATMPTSNVATTNIKAQTKKLIRQGSDPAEETYIMDVDSTVSRAKSKLGCTPCLTCARATTGHWISSWGRRFLKTEMMRLQGMNPTKFKLAISLNQVGHQLGNSMSVNVFERVLARLLPAAGMTGRLMDRWASGAALKELMASRDLDFGTRLRRSAASKLGAALRQKRKAPAEGSATAAKRVARRVASRC